MIDKLSWITVYPEASCCLVMACVIALADLRVKSQRRTFTYVLTLATLGVVALMQAVCQQRPEPCTVSATWSSATRWATGSSALPRWR
jgi:hypothetical protein